MSEDRTDMLAHVGPDPLDLTLEAWTLDPGGFLPDAQPHEPIDVSCRLAYGGTDDGRALVICDPEYFDNPDNVLQFRGEWHLFRQLGLLGLTGFTQLSGHKSGKSPCDIRGLQHPTHLGLSRRAVYDMVTALVERAKRGGM